MRLNHVPCPDCYHTMPMPVRDKIHHFWITSNGHFTKQIHLFSNQNLFGCNISMIICIQNSCPFMGSEFLVSYRRLRTPKHFYGFSPLELSLTTTNGSFTRGGVYPCLLLPDISFIYHFIQLCDFVGLRPT